MSGLMKSIFGKPKMPKPEAPIAMPDEETVDLTRRRNMARRKQSGRSSTILTDPLGG